MAKQESILDLEMRIARLESQLAELVARFPAHSIPPQLIAEMDQLDEQILAAKSRLIALQNSK